MSDIGGKKAISLCILSELRDHASREEPLSTKELIERLNLDYGVSVERKAVARNLALLTEMGYPLSGYTENKRGYYLKDARESRESSADEAYHNALLLALAGSPLLDQAQRERLCEGMDVLVPAFFREPTPPPEGMMDVLRLLADCIRRNRQVSAELLQTMSDGSRRPILGMTLSPYALFSVDGRFYLAAGHLGDAALRHFALEDLSGVRALAEEAKPISDLAGMGGGLDLARYVRQNFLER